MPALQVGVFALHHIGHGFGVQIGDAPTVACGNAIEFPLVGWMDAIVEEEYLLWLVVGIVLEETNHRDASLSGIEVVNGVAEVEHIR